MCNNDNRFFCECRCKRIECDWNDCRPSYVGNNDYFDNKDNFNKCKCEEKRHDCCCKRDWDCCKREEKRDCCCDRKEKECDNRHENKCCFGFFRCW